VCHEFYWFNVSRYSNVITIPKDSKKVKFPVDQQFVFGFIDGNHSPEYVVNDFYLVWKHLVPGGIVAFHDIVPGPPENVGCLMNQI
jgi:hypothetical protein